MLQQCAAGLRWRHALATTRQEWHAEHIFHVADARRGGGERQMRAFGAVGDAAGFDDVTEQAQIREIETHRKGSSFVFCETRVQILLIVAAKTSYIFAKYESWRNPSV